VEKTFKTIKVTEENNIATLILNRPEKRNSLNREMVIEIKEAINNLKDKRSITGLIITGAGKAFCAGADLAYLKSLLNASYDENLNDSLELKDMYYNIYTFPQPTIAMVNGPAIAGGCGLANVCDFIFATDQAKFGYPEVKIGFVAALVSIFLVQSIGEKNAKRLLLSGQLISAHEANNIGFVDEIIQEKELESFCFNYLNAFKEISSQSLSFSKKLFYDIIFDDLETKLTKACELNAQSRNTKDFREGINSFLEKREPNWVKKY
jgi:methylglutaconyl-CoA hydratase